MSANRDLDPQGVGKRVFLANKEKIEELVKQTGTS